MRLKNCFKSRNLCSAKGDNRKKFYNVAHDCECHSNTKHALKQQGTIVVINVGGE